MKLNAVNIGSLQGQMVQQGNNSNAINSNPLHNSNANNSADSFQNSNSSKNVSFKGLRTFLKELLESDSKKYAREALENFNALKIEAAKLGIATAELHFSDTAITSLKHSIWFEELKPEAKNLNIALTNKDDYYSLTNKIECAKLKKIAEKYKVIVDPDDNLATLKVKLDKYLPRRDSGSESNEGYSAPDGTSPFSPYNM